MVPCEIMSSSIEQWLWKSIWVIMNTVETNLSHHHLFMGPGKTPFLPSTSPVCHNASLSFLTHGTAPGSEASGPSQSNRVRTCTLPRFQVILRAHQIVAAHLHPEQATSLSFLIYPKTGRVRSEVPQQHLSPVILCFLVLPKVPWTCSQNHPDIAPWRQGKIDDWYKDMSHPFQY